jgi:hypothetical protein
MPDSHDLTEKSDEETEFDAPPPDPRRGRRHLRDELFKWLGPLRAVDTFVFVQINQLPHWKLSDRLLTRLSWMMSNSTGWLVFFLLATLADPQRGWKATRAVAPALVSCPRNTRYFVAIKMGRRQGARREHI